MDMFFDVFDRNEKQMLHVDITTVRTYTEQDLIDRQGNVHYLIVYGMRENRFIEEEFTTQAERAAKITLLQSYNAA